MIAHSMRSTARRPRSCGDKTGNNGEDAAGDIAIAWPDPKTPVVICPYTRGGKTDEPQFDVLFSAIGRLAAQRLA
jgi:beta-lactamase class A